MNNLIFAMMGKPMQSRTERPDAVIDAPKGNWVDEKAPAAWRPLLRMSRADRPIGTWLLLLPCWWGVGLAMMSHGPAWRDIWIVIACACAITAYLEPSP